MRFVIEGRNPNERVTLFFADEADGAAVERFEVQGDQGTVEAYPIVKDSRVVALAIPMMRRQLPPEMVEQLLACGREGRLIAVPYGAPAPPAFER